MIIKIDKTKNFTVVCNEIYRNPNISARAKGIYGYIMTLPPDWKLILSDLYKQFAEGRDAIRKAMAELEESGYIVKERAQNKEGKFTGWDITVFESLNRLTENPKLLNRDIHTINISSTNESINSNNTIVKQQKSDIRELFKTRYESKTKEISGSAAKLPWSGKEAKLLILDLETHGFETLKKYIEIFFSDKDNTIADFTRHRNKAGYSFSVFHGMIGKLALSKVRPAKVCAHCGKSIGHDDNCIISIHNRKMKQLEIDEINRSKDENKDFSFTDALSNIVNNKEATNG